MPYTPAQHRLFQAAAHNPDIARSHNIPVNTAGQMAAEGIKQPARVTATPKVRKPAATKGQVLARVLTNMKAP